MSIKRRVFISSPADRHLDERRYKVKWAVVGEIERLGYEAQAFGTDDGGRGLAAGRGWNAERVDEVMRRCVGAAVLGFSVGVATMAGEPGTVSVGSEYCHYEAAFARAYGLPTLSFLEEGVRERAFFNRYGDVQFYALPADADESWVNGRGFQSYLAGWRREMENRRDIFLGYSSGSGETAGRVRRYLEEGLGASVLDWADDFAPGGDILEEIRRASARCRAGVFLFTMDDRLEPADGDASAVTRDNVVFEAGFFAHAKGLGGVLVILEAGSRLPDDLGGKIFAGLADRQNVASIEPAVRRFLDGL
jgi:hypothetical protein